MNQYPFENLSAADFENLIIRICKEVLGIGCSTFSEGRDGAKDGWFTGTARHFPSDKGSWNGTFCIQAKHTTNPVASCSDNDFSKNRTGTLSKEIKRLQEVFTLNPFDNYILFTNRKLSGGAHADITQSLRKELNITNAEIIGKEGLNAYLNDYPHIARQFGIHLFTAPLRFYEKDLRDIIVLFSDRHQSISGAANEIITSLEMIDKEDKNALNNLSEDYFDFIKTESLHYFGQIDSFLKAPQNTEYMNMYSNTVSDLQAQICLNRSRFNDFMHVIEHLVDFTVANNQEQLLDRRKLVRVFIHFMYFNCDIGKK